MLQVTNDHFFSSLHLSRSGDGSCKLAGPFKLFPLRFLSQLHLSQLHVGSFPLGQRLVRSEKRQLCKRPKPDGAAGHAAIECKCKMPIGKRMTCDIKMWNAFCTPPWEHRKMLPTSRLKLPFSGNIWISLLFLLRMLDRP